jgi:hypothetical protein
MTTADCDTAANLYCNRLTFKCEVNPPDVKDGELCGILRDGSGASVQCSGGSTCSAPAADGFARACQPRAKYGEPCNVTPLGPICVPGAFCLNQVCVYLQPAECN